MKNYNATSWHEYLHYVLQQVSRSYETIPNAPKYYETHRNISIGSNGGNWLCSFHKIPRDFVSRTFVLTAAVRYVMHQVSCSYETIPNSPKYYETHRNISLGFNGVDWVCSLRKITMLLRCTNFCINCTSSVCFATSFIQLRNVPKCTQILRDAPKH